MDLGAIFLTLAVTVLVGLFVARPFIQHRKNPGLANADHDESTLLAKREQFIEAIQELDFDHALGKIPSEDYPTMRLNLVKRASQVLKELDVRNKIVKSDEDVFTSLEAEVAKKRTDGLSTEPAKAAKLSDDELEDRLASRRAALKAKPAGFCHHCGKPIVKADKFCPACGKAQ